MHTRNGVLVAVMCGVAVLSWLGTGNGGAQSGFCRSEQNIVPSWTADCDQPGAEFGTSVAGAGDVNGDGYSDVIIGAPWYDIGTMGNAGRAYVYYGSASGLQPTAAWIAQGDQERAYFGHSVASAGDVNGDEFSDVIVGAYGYDNGTMIDAGRALVYCGSDTGLSEVASWTVEGDLAEAWLGYSVAGAGDVNGDQFSDVIVGAHGHDSTWSDGGRAYLFYGSGAGLSMTAGWMSGGDKSDAQFGASVASAGDVNNDGCSDVIIGANGYGMGGPEGYFDGGRAYVFHGNTTGLSTAPAWWADCTQDYAKFGTSVSGAGDVNGDQFSDVIVGAYGYDKYDIAESNEGRAFVYCGSDSGLLDSASWFEESDQQGAFFGYSVAGAGDCDGYGYSEIIVGAYLYDDGSTDDQGWALVFCGTPTGPTHGDTASAWAAHSDQKNAHFGYSVASAGDVNGDGASDVIVGAPLPNGNGRAYVYYGIPECVPIKLAGFEATPSEEGIIVKWTAAGPSSIRAFFIHRSVGDPDGDYLKLSDEAIEVDARGSKDYSFLDANVVPGTLYYYKLEAIEAGASGSAFFGPCPAVASMRNAQCWLGQNVPNPFSRETSTLIHYSLARAGKVEIRIVDVEGRLIKAMVEQGRPGGNWTRWDGTDQDGRPAVSGVYVYEIVTNTFTAHRKMLLVE